MAQRAIPWGAKQFKLYTNVTFKISSQWLNMFTKWLSNQLKPSITKRIELILNHFKSLIQRLVLFIARISMIIMSFTNITERYATWIIKRRYHVVGHI